MAYINRSTFEVERIEHIVGKTGHCIVYACGTVEVTHAGRTERVAATRWQDNDILCGAALQHRFQPGATPSKVVIVSTDNGREFYNCSGRALDSIEWAAR